MYGVTGTELALGLTALVILSSVARWAFQKDQLRGSKEIPGPPGVPILRNIPDIPRKDQWIVFNRWAKQYGMIFYFPSRSSAKLNV
jgi:hypothetical protein